MQIGDSIVCRGDNASPSIHPPTFPHVPPRVSLTLSSPSTLGRISPGGRDWGCTTSIHQMLANSCSAGPESIATLMKVYVIGMLFQTRCRMHPLVPGLNMLVGVSYSYSYSYWDLPHSSNYWNTPSPLSPSSFKESLRLWPLLGLGGKIDHINII